MRFYVLQSLPAAFRTEFTQPIAISTGKLMPDAMRSLATTCSIFWTLDVNASNFSSAVSLFGRTQGHTIHGNLAFTAASLSAALYG